jgi:hypothetical protein
MEKLIMTEKELRKIVVDYAKMRINEPVREIQWFKDWWAEHKQYYELGKEEGDFKVGDNVKFKIRGIECEGNIMEFRDLALIHSDYGDYERKISELTKIK